MSHQELQEEEREVLASIYDSDEFFKQNSPISFSYRVGEVGEPKSLLVEVTWGESYPDELPTISLDAFFNKHLSPSTKQSILKVLTQEADGLLGSPMTYSLFEVAKERADELISDVPDDTVETENKTTSVETKAKKEKKEVLTKQQKRRLAGRLNAQGERPRGWNWVDVVKHLSKTGSTQNST